jgi:hypothetical protein
MRELAHEGRNYAIEAGLISGSAPFAARMPMVLITQQLSAHFLY